MTPENVSHLTPLRAVRVEPDYYRFDWPPGSPKAVTYGEQKHLDRLIRRNAIARGIPFPVIDSQEDLP